MRLNIAIPEAQVSKPVLDAALESVTRLNEQLIDGGAPTSHQLIEQGAKWKPEPPGQEHFDHAGILAQRGWGDCDDWAPLHAATLRKTGVDHGAKAVVHRSGPQMWHAVVERSDGSIEDPSKAAGMPEAGARGVHGAVLPLMNMPMVVGGTFVARPQVAVRPTPNGFQGRVDLPWHWREHLDSPPTPTDHAMTALHMAPVAPQALVGALVGAMELGNASGIADPEHITRLAAIADACEGCPAQELAAIYGPEHAVAAMQVVGSFFGDIAKAVTSPITSTMNFVKHPSLSNLTHIATDPFNAALKTVPGHQMLQPIAKMAQPFAGMIPGFGPLASMGLDVLSHGGLPRDPGQLAQMAMRNAANIIPGGGMLAQAMPFFGGGGGGGMPGMLSSAMPFLQQGLQAWPTAFH